jgi:arginine deiminase
MLCVESEIAPLKRVIVSRPKEALGRIMPENTLQFLFDDLLCPEIAQQEHDRFTQILKENGVEVLFLESLLEEVMNIDAARKWILSKLFCNYDFGVSFVQEFHALLMKMSAKQLSFHLLAGLTAHEANLYHKGLMGLVCEPTDFLLPPHPNHYFTRDPSCWIDGGVCINRMQYAVRRGESLNFAAIYKYHPLFTRETIIFRYA